MMVDGTTEKKQKEKAHHDAFYDNSGPLPEIDPAIVESVWLQPAYRQGEGRYADNKRAFHRIIRRHGGWIGKYVNDYACGTGDWAVYFALTGAARVAGFDLSDVAIRRGRERIVRQRLQDRVQLDVMDASALSYPDNEFDIIIGHSAIHHVIKYPNVFDEIHRVLKPGGKAFFYEGLADFPLFKLWWKRKGEVPEGDVPIFAKDVRHKAHMFADVEIIGDTFIYSVKTFLIKKDTGQKPGPLVKLVLRTCKYADNALFVLCPPLRRWGSMSYIILTK